MQALSFPRGNTYVIVAEENKQALKVQGYNAQTFKGSRIVSAPPNPNDLGQLFMIEKTGFQQDSYQIVNCLSNYVFDEESNEIRLKPGKQSKDQLFFVQKAPLNGPGNYYWIKCSVDGSKALALEGILRYKDFDPNAPNQIFDIQLAFNNTLDQFNIIVNKNSGKALDIPEGTFEHGERIIQYTVSRRFNQRWSFIPHSDGYLIKSLLTGLVLDIEGESKEGGAKVVQWQQTGNSNQIWRPEQVGDGLFKIRSCHAPGMYLCIKHQQIDDGGKLEIYDQENPSMYWKIQSKFY